MDPVTGGIAATCAILAILLFLKVMGQSAALATANEELANAQRDLKKATQQTVNLQQTKRNSSVSQERRRSHTDQSDGKEENPRTYSQKKYERKVNRMKMIRERASEVEKSQECDVIHKFLQKTKFKKDGLKTTQEMLKEFEQ